MTIAEEDIGGAEIEIYGLHYIILVGKTIKKQEEGKNLLPYMQVNL